MMSSRSQGHVLVLIAMLLGLAMVAGCGGGGSSLVYQNVSERVGWSPRGHIAFASFGGNARLYIYRMNDDGGGLLLLTPSDNDADLLDEGGRHPTYSADGLQVAIATRRGPSEAIFLISPEVGDTQGLAPVTDDSGSGADNQPSFAPNGTQLVFSSTRRAANADICIINTDGSGRQEVVATDAEEHWPVVSPDGTMVAYQSDANGNTDIWVKALGGDPADPGTCLTADSPYRDEAPAWSPDGLTLCFHSNRSGDFDIWAVDAADGGNPRAFTADPRSDGYPVFDQTGTRIAINRDRELWTVPARPYADWADEAESEAQQLTRRY